jgi:hypothetical protein
MLRTLWFAAIATLGLSVSLPVAGSRQAEARMIIMPSVPRSCPGTPTWQATLTCLERFGTTKIVRSQGNVRLVQLREGDARMRTEGLYLYVQAKKRWHLGGMYLEAKPSVIGLSTPTYEHRKLFRIDVVYAANEEVLIDELTIRNAFVRRKTAVFCSGESSMCTRILMACDVFVGGRLQSTFRGTLEYQNAGLMNVTGDRSHADEQCSQPEDTLLPLPNLDAGFDTLE